MRRLAVAAGLCLAARARAQDTLPAPPGLGETAAARVVESAAPLERIPVLLPQEHWAVRAVERLHGMGMAPDYFPAQRAVPLSVVARALRDASRRAAYDPFGSWIAVDWLRRLRDEFAPAAGPGVAMLPRELSLEVAREHGRLSPAEGYFDTRQAPEIVGGATRPQVRASTGFTFGGTGAAWAQGRYDERGPFAPRWEVAAAAGPIALSVGRQPVGYGHARGGSVVLSPEVPVTRAELRTERPLRLPSVLGSLGPLTLETFVSRMDRERHPGRPWLWGARLAGRPHPRLTLGVNRASIFGTEAEPVTAERVLRMFVGVIRNSEFENQVLSFDAAWRLPTEDILPATVYVEWGADDGAGALDEQPARLAGIRLPGAFGFPELTLGAEYARIEWCCGHGSWYFNGTFRGNWALRDRPLAHPLGGQGWEGLGYFEVDGDVLRLEGRGFARSRRDDNRFVFGGGNLFTPGHGGRSYGGSLQGALRLARGLELRAGMYREDGDDNWREERRQVELAARF